MSLKVDLAQTHVRHANPNDGTKWLTGGENSIMGTSFDFIIRRSTKRPLNMDSMANLLHVSGDWITYKKINCHKMDVSHGPNWKQGRNQRIHRSTTKRISPAIYRK